MSNQEYMFEHYFVNYAFRDLFPFGRANGGEKKEIPEGTRSPLVEFSLMAFHYALMKNLLVGISGYKGNSFGSADVIGLMQAYDKNVISDGSYREKVIKFFHENGIVSVAFAVIIIKN